MNIPPYIKSNKLVVGIVVVVFAVGFFVAGQYLTALVAIALLIPLLKLEELRKLVFGKDGFEVEFSIPEENIRQDIEDNQEEVTQGKVVEFRKIEQQVLADVHRKTGGEMKQQIHFVYGEPDRPEFAYTPDATIRTEEALVFIEIKYILKPELAQGIVNRAAEQLNQVLTKFRPSAGKPLIAKLILVSMQDLSKMHFEIPEGIEVEFYAPPSV